MWEGWGEGLTCVVVLCKVDGYLSANAPRGSYYQGHLLFRSHCSCTSGERVLGYMIELNT